MIETYWQKYLNTLDEGHPHHQATYTAWGFGDSPSMMDELGTLVAQGIKSATASLLWEYEVEGEELPQVGEISIILDGENQPLCIIETTEIRIVPFNEVEAEFAYDEGEGDRSLAYWRDAHWRFFGRNMPEGYELSETMPIVCERFNLLFDVRQNE